MLTKFGLLKISGQDATKLLQGQLTCDVTKLVPYQATLGAHCNPQGRIISLFIIFKHDEVYYLLMPYTLVDIALTALKKYAVFYKTEITHESELVVMSYQGDTSHHPKDGIIHITFLNKLLVIGTETAATSIDDATFKTTLIKASIPFVYPETSGLFLPHELNLPQLGGVSFDKGCYRGQEIIARMHYRGKLKSHLYRKTMTTNTPLLPGMPVYVHEDNQPKECGTIVDSVKTMYNQSIALIVIEEKYAECDLLCLS